MMEVLGIPPPEVLS